MKKIKKKESNILFMVAVITYLVLKITEKLLVKIPDMVYIALMFICIGIIFSALKSQKQGK